MANAHHLTLEASTRPVPMSREGYRRVAPFHTSGEPRDLVVLTYVNWAKRLHGVGVDYSRITSAANGACSEEKHRP